ncbi:cytochrome c3 family protein [Aromatoleum diolicum]|uniref:Doubled CXXCH motif domain-containing protein n=1 Tax=Aromatoleum diolicum TaxID=75796 RepID=A0ABX1Q6R2_9RHOO|nr:cytochrome c3 family protein [Aromatoleum diolicum]NMG74064.1 hypothetical protein [Aromatoleum diolicum]
MNATIRKVAIGLSVVTFAAVAWAGSDTGRTKFSNTGGITNTRHNLTQRPIGTGSAFMDGSRNDYGQVCVYCHTPHGANTKIQVPLWNRTIRGNVTFNTYNELNTSSLTQAVTRPGANSLSCLSCHDGQTAVDSIINMPGSGLYKASQEDAATTDNGFLNLWTKGGDGAGSPTEHTGLNNSGAGCLACHAPGAFVNATDFRAFVIGTDLRNDHPVGITFPTNNTDFKATTGAKGPTRFFDVEGNGNLDSKDIRLYDTGDGPEVECASCHDPHGVDSGAGTFNASFLRVSNDGSAVCLTCHTK